MEDEYRITKEELDRLHELLQDTTLHAHGDEITIYTGFDNRAEILDLLVKI